MTATTIAPNPTHGVEFLDGWRFAVEAALPENDASLWGVAKWEEDPWSALNWNDLTRYTTGCQWTRGNTSGKSHSRPQTGRLVVTLDARGDGVWLDPFSGVWRSDLETVAASDGSDVVTSGGDTVVVGGVTQTDVYQGPGTLVRVVCHRADGAWIPQSTGIVTSWVPRAFALGKATVVEIVAEETTAELARTDLDALGGVEGGGETAGKRVERLLRLAPGWRFGFHDEAESPVTMQSTDMADNRLGEVDLTADSADLVFYSHRSGVGLLTSADARLHPSYQPADNPARWGTGEWDEAVWSELPETLWPIARISSLFYSGLTLSPTVAGPGTVDPQGRPAFSLVYDADSLVVANDDESVVNVALFARAGSTVQEYRDGPSIGRYGVQALTRHDLISQTDGQVYAVAQAVVERRAWIVKQVRSVTVRSRPENMPALFIIDIGDWLTVERPASDPSEFPAAIAGMDHSVTPLDSGGLSWVATVALDTYPQE